MNFNNKNLKIALVLTSISLVVCIIIIINSGMLNIKEGIDCPTLSAESKKKIIMLKKQILNNKGNTGEEIETKLKLTTELESYCKPEEGCEYPEC